MKKFQLIGIDYLTLFWILWNLVYSCFGWHQSAETILHTLTYFSIGVGIILLFWFQYQKDIPLLRFLRYAYPILLFGYFFESTTAVNHIIFSDFLDPHFQAMDFAIFQYQPVLVWSVEHGGYWMQELMHFAYFSYYLMIAGVPIYLYVKKREAFHESLFIIVLVFYICYFVYSWLPVIGGRYFPEAMHMAKQPRYGLFTHIMALIYTYSPHLGGAFPSSHVAIAIVITLAAVRHIRLVGMAIAPITILLCFSTVYCHYHYFIDVVAGTVLALIMFPISLKLYRLFPMPGEGKTSH